MTVALPSCVRRSPYRLVCAGLPTVVYIQFDQHVVTMCAPVVSLHLHHWPFVFYSSSFVACSSGRVVVSGSHTMHVIRTFYISLCPCIDDGCSRGKVKPKFLGKTDSEARLSLCLHLQRSSAHWKSLEDARSIAEHAPVEYHDEEAQVAPPRVPHRPTTALMDAPPRVEHRPAPPRPSGPRSGDWRPDVENPRPFQVRRLTSSSEFVNIVQSAELLVAAAGHAGGLASSASVAFFEQAQEIQDCIDRLNILAGSEQ